MAKKSYFLRSTWNLATKSLEKPELWPETFREQKVEYRPKALSRYLEKHLAPQDIRTNQNLRYERIRSDLNKYRPWLMRHLLLDFSQAGTNESGWLFPEDMPKIADALYLFHKHHADIADRSGNPQAGTIQHYRSLKAFRKAIEPYETPPSPLLPYERESAFKAHIKEYGGDGGASIIATLENGTVLLHIKTEKASLALGSPHWCTSYRNKETHFEKYKKNLLEVVESTGRRYQIHFDTFQVMDANDITINLNVITDSNPGLSSALQQFILEADWPIDSNKLMNQTYEGINHLMTLGLPQVNRKCLQHLDRVLADLEKPQPAPADHMMLAFAALGKTPEEAESAREEIWERTREQHAKYAPLWAARVRSYKNQLIDLSTQTAAISGTRSVEASRTVPVRQPMV